MGFPDALPADFPLVRRWDGYCVLNLSTSSLEPGGVDKGITLSSTSGTDALGHVAIDSARVSFPSPTDQLEYATRHSPVDGSYVPVSVTTGIAGDPGPGPGSEFIVRFHGNASSDHKSRPIPTLRRNSVLCCMTIAGMYSLPGV